LTTRSHCEGREEEGNEEDKGEGRKASPPLTVSAQRHTATNVTAIGDDVASSSLGGGE
jgi:hypothetical protein